MNLIDWILNVAALFLWVDWRSGRGVRPPSLISLASSLRETNPRRSSGWGSMAGLLAILLVRPFFYHSVGSASDWTPKLDLLAITLPWRSDLLGRMFLYSTLSFALTLGFFYCCLLLVSAAHRPAAESEMMQRFVRLQLGLLDLLPWWLKLLLPLLGGGLCWAALAPFFTWLGLLPGTSGGKLWGQALAIGLGSYLAWKWFLVAILLLHTVNIYVFLGTHPAWAYITVVARKLLRPFSFLKFGKADLAPLFGIAVVLVSADWVIWPAVMTLFERFIA